MYCPYNWSLLDEEERGVFDHHAAAAAAAAAAGETLAAVLMEGRIQMLDITGEPLAESLNQLV